MQLKPFSKPKYLSIAFGGHYVEVAEEIHRNIFFISGPYLLGMQGHQVIFG